MDVSNIPFPVESPFHMRPHMRTLHDGESILIKDEEYDLYLEAKERYYGPCYGDSVSNSLVKSAIDALKKYSPVPIDDTDTDGLVYKLTMSMQEDFVILAPNKKGELSAQVLSVHLPSGWDPRQKANLSFSEIHEPLADADLIKKSSNHISKIICTKGPFIRHVWTISNSDQLSRRPDLTYPWSDENLSQMYYRCERQTTIPISDNSSLFLIRVFVRPLLDIFEDQHKKDQIIDSVFSMSNAVLEYKNLNYVKEYFSLHVV